MSDMYYTDDHEYVSLDGDVAVVGISDYAQKALGDIVYVELPEIGASFEQGDEAGVVESVKSASEIYVPVSGEIVEINADVANNPALVNTDPLGDGWLFKIKLAEKSELDDLKNDEAYAAYVDGL